MSSEGDGTENKTDATVKFFKSRPRGNIRKRNNEEIAENDSSESAVVKKEKTSSGNALSSSTKEQKKGIEKVVYESTMSSESAISKDRLAAPDYVEIDTDHTMDARGIAERVRDLGEDSKLGEDGEKVYKGMAQYSDFLPKREQTGLSKGTGIKAGPIRNMHMYARAISRIDYQPDVRKDYKETGICGFGDSCKFMHDRGDYKNSVELEKEWEADQAARKKALENPQEEEDPEGLDDIPFVCPACRGPFVDPVVTKCKHYFCESCALKMTKCETCNENTNRAFRNANAVERKKLEKSRLRHEEREKKEQEQNQNQEDADE